MNVVVSERCNWCSRFRPPHELLSLASGQKMCQRCHHWHSHALAVLSGNEFPRGCQECGLSREDLERLTSGLAVKMYIVPKDGVYQVHCETCKDNYCRKRGDLYRDTKFGKQEKI